jgi:hypothetical protein
VKIGHGKVCNKIEMLKLARKEVYTGNVSYNMLTASVNRIFHDFFFLSSQRLSAETSWTIVAISFASLLSTIRSRRILSINKG